MESIHIPDVTQPRVQDPQVFGCHGSFDTAAAVVPADDNVLYFEMTDCVVYDTHDVEIGVANEIGDVAVNEHLARLEASDGFGRDAGVGAAWNSDGQRSMLYFE
jgi:hypothetical protein